MPAGAVYYENEISETSAEELSKHILLLKSQLGKIEMVSFLPFCFLPFTFKKNKNKVTTSMVKDHTTAVLCFDSLSAHKQLSLVKSHTYHKQGKL